MAELEKVRSGQELEIKAGDWNALIDSARFAQTQRLLHNRQPAGTRQRSTHVWVKNNSGGDVPRFGVLAVSDVIYGPAVNLEEFKNGFAFVGSTPDFKQHSGKFVVTQEPIKSGEIGQALLDGATVVQLNVSNETYEFCDVAHEHTDYLLTTQTGSTRILYREQGPGLKWAVVRLCDTQPTPIVRFELEDDKPLDSPQSAQVLDTGGQYLGRIVVIDSVGRWHGKQFYEGFAARMIDRQTIDWPDGQGGTNLYEAYEILYLEAPARFCEVVLTGNLGQGQASATVLRYWGAAPNERNPGSPIVVYDRQNKYAHVKAGAIMTVVYDEFYIDPQNPACGRYVPLYVGPTKRPDVALACPTGGAVNTGFVEAPDVIAFDKTPGFQLQSGGDDVFVRLLKLGDEKLLATNPGKESLVQTDCPHAGVSLTVGRPGENLGYVRYWPVNGQPLYIAAAENMQPTLKWRMSSQNTGELATGSHPFAKKVKDASIVESHWTQPGLDGDLVVNRLPIRLKFDHGILIQCEDQGPETDYVPVDPYRALVYLDPSVCPAKPQNDANVAFVNPQCMVEDPCEQQQ